MALLLIGFVGGDKKKPETTVSPSMHLAKHELGADHHLDRKAKGDQAPEPIPNQTCLQDGASGCIPVPCQERK